MRNNIICSLLLGFVCAAQWIVPTNAHGQLSPGPYETFPFQEAFIPEAFFDLNTTSGQIADWTGWSSTSWVSPDAYDGHQGSDFSVQTGTPLYAIAAGTVTELVMTNAPNTHPPTTGPYGNYVRIAVDDPSPLGQQIDVLFLHMLSATVTNGQRVSVGTQVGYSDNTGNSTSEHVHVQSEVRGGSALCPMYWGHYKYPIIFSAGGFFQLGRVVKVTAASTPVRTDRFDSSSQITTAYKDQLYFCSYPKRGYYQVFIPNQTSYRSGWLRATDVEEVFIGTVIQAVPDNVTFTQLGQLQTKYVIRSSPDDAAGQIGQIVFGGGRFVADQTTNGYYRIPVPGASATWGWVKPDNRMIVYPQLTNPNVNLAALPNNDFPIIENFSTVGPCMFGRPKFTRSVVKAFSPSSPGGDGNAVFVTDAKNTGNGFAETVLVGKPGHRNYFVQCDVYFNFSPSYINGATGCYERYGIFLRDDGFAGMSDNFEGGGNDYAFVWDSDDGNLRAGIFVNAVVTNFISPTKYVTNSGWHTLRIEARTNQIKYYFDNQLLVQTNHTSFPSGQCGFGYRWYPGSQSQYPTNRGAYFDNFVADTLDPVPLQLSSLNLLNDGKVQLQIKGDVGSTNAIDRASLLTNWTILTNVVNSNSVINFVDTETNQPSRFYRARRLP